MILINKKLLVTLGLSSVVVLSAMTAIQPGPPQQDMKAQNLKVLPKNLTHQQLDHVMEEWSHSLGVRCNFCHAPNEQTKRMDWASDAKPEKNMAREMFKMTATINKKYFGAEKDSLGMIANSGVNCYTCHNGKAHPEVVAAPSPQRMGPPPGGATGMPPPGGGTPPPAGNFH